MNDIAVQRRLQSSPFSEVHGYLIKIIEKHSKATCSMKAL